MAGQQLGAGRERCELFSHGCTVPHVLTSATRLDALGRLGRALADPTRCQILIALLEGPCYPAQLAERLGLTRSNVSNHLACLRGCGLVVATGQGRQVRYELADERLRHALDGLLRVVLAVDTDEPCLDQQ
jgi:DNA-binding transcriptional ArsR family regulator